MEYEGRLKKIGIYGLRDEGVPYTTLQNSKWRGYLIQFYKIANGLEDAGDQDA